MRSFFIFLFLLFRFYQAHAIYEIGNGGSVVVCKDIKNETESVELLDLYEERTTLRLSINEFEKKNFSSRSWLNTLNSFSPRRALLYQFYLNNFDIETNFTTNILPLSNDYGNLPQLPQNCHLEQLIIQPAYFHPYASDILKRYYINTHLWKALSPLNQEAAKLHEIIYRERITQCITFRESSCFPSHFSLNSEFIRKLSSKIVTGQISSYSNDEIQKLFIHSGLLVWEFRGIPFWDSAPENITPKIIDSPFFTSDSSLAMIELNDETIMRKQNFVISDFFNNSFPNQFRPYFYLRVKGVTFRLPNQIKAIYENNNLYIRPLSQKSLDLFVKENQQKLPMRQVNIKQLILNLNNKKLEYAFHY